MFATVEKYSGPAKVLLGLIAITFIGFGASTLSAPGSDYIVKIGEQKISQQDVRQAMHNTQSSEQAVFNLLVDRAFLIEGAQQMGMSASLEQIKQQIVNSPIFHDETGKFNQERFNQYLTSRGIGEKELIDDLRNEIAVQNIAVMMQNSFFSDAQIKQLANIYLAERTVRSITLQPETFAAQVKFDDASLKAFYEQHKTEYTQPQAIKYQYIALTLDDLANKQTVSEEELREAFAAQTQNIKPKYDTAHIMFNVDEANKATIKAQVESILAQAQAEPARFAELAAQYSQDPDSAQMGGNLGNLDADSPYPQTFKDAVFKMQANQIALIDTGSSLHIVKLNSIQTTPVFEQERPRLETELKRRKAQQNFAQAREELNTLTFDHPDSLDVAAQKMGLTINTVDTWTTRADVEAKKLPSEWTEAVFNDDVIKSKHNSAPISIGNEVVQVVRAIEVRQEQIPAFETIKAQIQSDYTTQEGIKLAQEQAKKMVADLNSGKISEIVWSSETPATLTSEQARASMPPQAFAALIKAKPTDGKPAYVLLEGLPLPVIMEVQKISLPQNEQSTTLVRQLMQQNEVLATNQMLSNYLRLHIPFKQGAQRLDSTNTHE